MLPLSVDFVTESIGHVLLASTCSTSLHQSPNGGKDLILRRVSTANDWDMLSSTAGTASRLSDDDSRPPFYFGFQVKSRAHGKYTEDLIGFCTFYIAYSTWDGRMLYVDHMFDTNGCSLLQYRVLAKIAIRIGCTRLTWKQKERPQWDYVNVDPEYLDDWVFLSMDRLAMSNFVGLLPSPPTTSSLPKDSKEKERPQPTPLSRCFVEKVIKETLLQQKTPTNVKLRLAGLFDTDAIARLVKLLAIYEKEPDAVNMTARDYFTDGYNSSTEPLFYCILADIETVHDVEPRTRNNTAAAMGLFYFGHSMTDGRFLYLEDLFCEEEFRGKGLGTAIMKQLAHISLALDCYQFIWTALDWNAPALSFYNKIGATLVDNLKITRYCGDNIRSFAESD